MLKQGALIDVKQEKFDREKSHLVITMRFYPRFLRKELRDEFVSDLAPERQLLHEFNAAQKKLGDHNPAFAEVDYERRLQLNDSGLAHLERLEKLSKKKDVYLFCICQLGDRCHREMLLLLAHELFGTAIGEVYHQYPEFEQRFPEFKSRVK